MATSYVSYEEIIEKQFKVLNLLFEYLLNTKFIIKDKEGE